MAKVEKKDFIPSVAKASDKAKTIRELAKQDEDWDKFLKERKAKVQSDGGQRRHPRKGG